MHILRSECHCSPTATKSVESRPGVVARAPLAAWESARACLGVVVLALIAPAQDGANDPTFNVADDGTFGDGSGASWSIHCSALQPDGKIVIGGAFTSYNGTPRNRIARIDADGSLDATFDPGTGLDGEATAVAIQLDGKVLVGGSFGDFDGTPCGGLIRLNADGSPDASFVLAALFPGQPWSIDIQSDGKILIAGDFSTYGGVARSCVARLNVDGTLDLSFDPGTGTNNRVYAVEALADGDVLIGGLFTTYDGIARNRVARLNSDGSLDAAFDPGVGADNQILALASRPDGKVWIGGYFTSYAGTSRNRIARLNADGSLDTTFDPGAGANAPVHAVYAEQDGKVLFGGYFSAYAGVGRLYVARAHADGSLDAAFESLFQSLSGSHVQTILRQPDGKTLLGGELVLFDGLVVGRLVRVDGTGMRDATFNPGTGASSTVRDATLLPDGRALICGNFRTYNGQRRSRVARLNVDGGLDPAFDPAAGANGEVRALAPLPDGRALIAGAFTTYAGINCRRMARLNTDGSLDTSFGASVGPNGTVMSIALQPDGKAILVGAFDAFSFIPRSGIVRVHVDGSLDSSFAPGAGATGSSGVGTVYQVSLEADGRILIGGSFTRYGNALRNRIARVLPDGGVDASFDSSAGPNGTVFCFARQADGRVLVGGSFTSSHGLSRPRVARLEADGSLDTSFDPGVGPDGTYVLSIALQPDGSVLISGDFDAYAGVPRRGIARLHADGSLDTSFDPGAGLGEPAESIVLQPDGRALLGGGFTTYDGATRNRVARIRAVAPFSSFCSGDGSATPCPCGNAGAPGNGCANSVNAAGAVVSGSGTASITADTLTLTGLGMPDSSALYFQGTAQQGGGLGSVFGDGLRCASGFVTRLGVRPNVGGSSSYPALGDAPISIRGGVTGPGVRIYQAWYRNAAMYCTTSTFNLTQGLRVLWWP